MALSGPEAMRSLDDAVRDIRREEDDIAKRLARSGERIAKLQENQAELFRELAKVRLADADTVAQPLSEAERRARDMLDQHSVEVTEAEAALKALDERIAAKARTRRERLEDLDKAQNELRALSARIAQAIAVDPAYAEKRERAEELRGYAEEAMRKTETAEADREQKGKPYREDPLFMYLWEAGYGTRNYKANNLVRWLDSLVARMIGYNKARPNFAMLNEIPLRLREHAEHQISIAQEAEAELDTLEAAAIDAAGGKPVREALSAAQAAIETIDAEMVALEDERDEQAASYRQLAEGRDPRFEEAVHILGSSLERQDVASLMAEARRTPSPADDVLVKRIEDTRVQISEEEQDNTENKSRLKVLAGRRRELEDIEFEFKKARFDDPRSTFREDRLAGDMLNEFLRGAITAASYWDAWQRSQRWRPGTTDWGGGFGLPRSGRTDHRAPGGFTWPSSPRGGSPWSGRSGGFSRPRTGSRGSRSSGGFKTGGGF